VEFYRSKKAVPKRYCGNWNAVQARTSENSLSQPHIENLLAERSQFELSGDFISGQ
jgi:hypothetical protein